jgi:uracil-DNA glycosylase
LREIKKVNQYPYLTKKVLNHVALLPPDNNPIKRQMHPDSAIKTIRALFSGLEDFPLLHPMARPIPITPSPTVQNISNCTQCGRHRARKHVVIGQVVENSKLVIVGAGPTLGEDEANKPFQGNRGELLDKMLNAIGFARHQVSLLHVVKCYSPSGTDASDADMQACYQYLQNQIRAAGPLCILAMGSGAAQTLIRTNGNLASVRGKKWEWDGIPVYATHEPLELLQFPERKKEAWADLKLVIKELELLS